MGGVFAASAARVVSGIGLVACAAVVAFAIGGGGVFGGLGGLFGRNGGPSLEVAEAGSRGGDIIAAPRAAAPGRLPHSIDERVRVRPRAQRRKQPRRRTATPPAAAPPSADPTPGPLAPAPSLPPAPAPSPGGGQTVAFAGETVKQVTNQAPPPLQPVTQQVSEAVDTLVETCRGLPACP